MKRPFSQARQRPDRAGASAVEFAFLAPFLVALLLGMFELSRGILVKEALSNAVQRGARTGSLPGKANSDVQSAISSVMQADGISGYTVTILVNDVSADVSSASRNDKVAVRISVPVSQVFWVTTIFLKSSTLESETVVMLRQG